MGQWVSGVDIYIVGRGLCEEMKKEKNFTRIACFVMLCYDPFLTKRDEDWEYGLSMNVVSDEFLLSW